MEALRNGARMVKNGKCKEQLIAEANRVRTAVVEHYHRSMREGKVADTRGKRDEQVN